MNADTSHIIGRMARISLGLSILLGIAALSGLCLGSSVIGFDSIFGAGAEASDPSAMIVWRLRFPRVICAALVGAALSLGGLVFQALLRNPLAEPYILGISGGAAIGAISGILLGLSVFPGISLLAFAGSMATLVLVLVIASSGDALKKDSMLLSGVMVNAFASAVIMFLISLSSRMELHSIVFWLMGDLSTSDMDRVFMLAAVLLPCFVVIFLLAHPMNLLLMGRETARSMGVNTGRVTFLLLFTTSLMVAASVCNCGILGFVGLVIPHILRLAFGADHRLLVPGAILGGGAYMVLCDMLARVLPGQGEMPVGVITAMIGAPIFIILLKRGQK